MTHPTPNLGTESVHPVAAAANVELDPYSAEQVGTLVRLAEFTVETTRSGNPASTNVTIEAALALTDSVARAFGTEFFYEEMELDASIAEALGALARFGVSDIEPFLPQELDTEFDEPGGDEVGILRLLKMALENAGAYSEEVDPAKKPWTDFNDESTEGDDPAPTRYRDQEPELDESSLDFDDLYGDELDDDELDDDGLDDEGELDDLGLDDGYEGDDEEFDDAEDDEDEDEIEY